jgi:MoxR-like ATPase
VAGKTRHSEYLTLGVSPRGSMALFRAAQARAALHNRDYVTPDDLKSLVIPAFSHRVMVSSRYASTSKKSHQADQILKDILDTVPVPL